MVKINLLPPEHRKRENERRQKMIWFTGFITLVMLTSLGGIYSNLWVMENDIHRINRNLALLRPVEQAMLAAETQNLSIAQKETILENLTNRNSAWYDVLTRVVGCAPEELWFTDLSMEEGTVLQIKGISRNYLSVADFLAHLENEETFRTVELVEARQDKANKSPGIQFVLKIYLQ